MSIYEHGTTIKDSLELKNPGRDGIGKGAPKIDALDKLLGRIRYTDDIKLPRMAIAKLVRSPHSHAHIRNINKESVRSMPGVIDVIVGLDMPVKYGVIPWTKDEYPLAVKKARFVGDAVAAIIAEDELSAMEASLKLEVDYEILPAILNVNDAMSRTDIIVNEQAKVGNITKEVSLSFGPVEENLQKAHLVHHEQFFFHNTTHAAIEPHAAVADYSPSGYLTVYSSTQVPHYLHRTLAEVLSLPAHLIRVVQPPVGGAFGGKSEPFDLEFVVALASLRNKRPVKLLYTREEVFFAHRGRHPMSMQLTMGVSKEGNLCAVKNNIAIDGGAYASFGMITAFYAGQLLTGPVGMESYAFKATRYYTNKPACGPKRGHGSVQPRFAFEVMCDILAEKLLMDPIEFRLKNKAKEQQATVNGQRIGSLGLEEVLKKVAHDSRWYERYKKLPFGQGLGVATSMYISGTNYPVYPNDMPQSSVLVRIDRSGLVHIFSGASDIGQGSNTVLAHIASEELGVSFEQIRITSGDTDLTPVDLGAYSSRVTLMMGLAAQEALRKARREIAHAVAQVLNADQNKARDFSIKPKELIFSGQRVFVTHDPKKGMSFYEACILAESLRGSLVFSGDYRTKARGGDYRGGAIGASPAYSCTAHVAEVSVDKETGIINIQKIYVAHDCGRAINPLLVSGQMEGSTYMGAAEVTLEHFITDEEEGARRGMLIGPSLLDYKIPTTLDTPTIEASIIEKPDQNGPYGAKEAGEGPLHSTIPAIANAVYDAIGIRLFSLPFTPAKVREAIKEKERACATT